MPSVVCRFGFRSCVKERSKTEGGTEGGPSWRGSWKELVLRLLLLSACTFTVTPKTIIRYSAVSWAA